MHAKTSLAALAMLGFLLSAVAAADDAAKPGRSAAQSIDPQALTNLAKGMSKSKVKSLLGEPWRTVQYNDLDDVENEFWEYRGKDAHRVRQAG